MLYPAQCDPNQPDPTIFPNANFCTTNFGNLGRNTFRGPGQANFDFSLIKNFKITERQALRFTTDFFNIWNHANFANPAFTDVESIGTTNSPFGKDHQHRGYAAIDSVLAAVLVLTDRSFTTL